MLLNLPFRILLLLPTVNSLKLNFFSQKIVGFSMLWILFLNDSIFLWEVYARNTHNFNLDIMHREPDACALNAPYAVVCIALLLFLLLVLCVPCLLAIYSTKIPMLYVCHSTSCLIELLDMPMYIASIPWIVFKF